MFLSVTISGKVSSLAIKIGIDTWFSPKLGSGDMTVLPEYSTLFPDRFPLNLPYLPFILCKSPLDALKVFFIEFDSELSEFISWL